MAETTNISQVTPFLKLRIYVPSLPFSYFIHVDSERRDSFTLSCGKIRYSSSLALGAANYRAEPQAGRHFARSPRRSRPRGRGSVWYFLPRNIYPSLCPRIFPPPEPLKLGLDSTGIWDWDRCGATVVKAQLPS